ncbi:paeninodin family lasso peptide [Cohnella thermotolerans]|jgi:hypothetical protein|uniref:paeninodin family lasso peptide n=1 Tax=Cohnella thermotolerans TaxID=329858 RepID=UPI00040418DC
MKKAWRAPELETLDISMTMAGTGTKYVDWSYVGGKHLETNDDPKWSDYPAPPES